HSGFAGRPALKASDTDLPFLLSRDIVATLSNRKVHVMPAWARISGWHEFEVKKKGCCYFFRHPFDCRTSALIRRGRATT
ncbi:MAG: hypothetical protein ACLT65_09255, partial [Sutterella wadsworthensis]